MMWTHTALHLAPNGFGSNPPKHMTMTAPYPSVDIPISHPPIERQPWKRCAGEKLHRTLEKKIQHSLLPQCQLSEKIGQCSEALEHGKTLLG